MKSFPLRSSQSKPDKQQDPLSVSPNTITLRQPAAPVPPSTIQNTGKSHRSGRSTSDDAQAAGTRTPQKSSPVDPSLFSLGEGGGDAEAIGLLQPPPSPGTPPKKLWERQFGSFLRNRVRSGGSLIQELQQQQQQEPPSPPKNDGSVKGGKFFVSVFRNTSDASSKSSSSSRRSTSTDELDGTLRRGADKAYYSPRNLHNNKSCSTSATATSSTPTATTNAPNDAASSLPQPRIFGRDGLAALETALASSQLLLPNPPLFLPPRDMMPQLLLQQQRQLAILPNALRQQQQQQLDASKSQSSKQSSSAMKKAFTDFHNTSDDANSAYLGDDPSMLGRNLFFAQKNEQLVDGIKNATMPNSKSHNQFDLLAAGFVSATIQPPSGRHYRSTSVAGAVGTGSYNSSLDTVHETVNIKPTRILKQISGVEAWQAGRRYLIAPAALASCPVSAVTSLLANSFDQAKAAEQGMNADPFGMVVLGECLLSYVTTTSSSTTRTAKLWSSAQLVLRQNYLFEYDVGVDVRTSIPRGYAHLESATTKLHQHFADALELHFFGSPCAKADGRILMIRIVGRHQHHAAADDESIDDSVHLRPEIREAWRTCLNRAAALTQVSDLYEYDETNALGTGQYAEVRAARRRKPAVTLAAGNHKTGSTDRSGYDCALKIFDKDKFWRLVVKGRERADTIVREASVQATLLARCGQNPSFLHLRGLFETSNKVVLELELLEGTDLFQYISSKNVLKEDEAALILRDVLSCLDAMSKNGMAHRDVKPANILMCRELQPMSEEACVAVSSAPRVKVGDFGMAAFVGVDGQVRGRCGTPGYVAPEIFTAGIYGGYGNKVDVFSAGVTLYVMLCGYEPFYGETDDELKDANKAADVDFPDEDWANVSADAKDLVKQMMLADSAKRLDARQALQHPWFAKNLSLNAGMDQDTAASFHSRRDDACVVS